MKLKTYGKINLFLKILGKREDGYHNIETIIQRVDLFDEINICVDKSFRGIDIKIICDNENVPTDNSNLCYKAALWFMKKYNLSGRVEIDIKKNIPIEAGLGGGTSNGAGIIKSLCEIYGLNINVEDFCMESCVLGADFPYSLIGGTVLCEGIGDKLTKLPSFSGNNIVIVKPNFGFSTKEVYNKFKLRGDVGLSKDDFIKCLSMGDFYKVCERISNDLEQSNILEMEFIKNLKMRFKKLGCVASCMSGSGSSVYGIFKDMKQSIKCYEEFKKEFDDVFITKSIDI